MRHPILAGITVSLMGLACAITLMMPALKVVGIIDLSWAVVLLPAIILISIVALCVMSTFFFAGGITMLAFLGGFLKGLDRVKQQRKLELIKERIKNDRADLN